METIAVAHAPLGTGGSERVLLSTLEALQRDYDVIEGRGFDDRFEFEPAVTNSLKGRQMDRPKLAGTVIATHNPSWWLASS